MAYLPTGVTATAGGVWVTVRPGCATPEFDEPGC